MNDPVEQFLPRIAIASGLSPNDGEPEAPIATKNHRLTFLPEVEPTIRALFRDIARAQKRILIACYIVRDDRFGTALGEALCAAAARGVECRVIYDALGSTDTPKLFFELLEVRGVRCREYRPEKVAILSASPGPREHSRIILIDDVGYAGGIAFGDEWLSKERGGQEWHDVCVRIEGSCTGHFATAFEKRWREATGAPLDESSDVCMLEQCDDVQFIADATVGESQVYNQHRRAVQGARTRVWIESAYIFPPLGLLEDLYAAAARGVDVRLIVPAITDLPLIQHAERAEYAEWLAHGLTIYEYQGRVMHSKFALVDDDWCTIGSFNPCPPGIIWANELNLVVRDRAFVARTAAQFVIDLGRSLIVTEEMARSRPVFDKLRDRVASNLLSTLDAMRSGTR